MLAHLGEYRNPFVTVELLPRFLEPKGEPYSDESKGGQLVTQHLQTDAFAADEDDDIDDASCPKVQKSIEDIDGGSYPEWNSNFIMKFKPPKKTSCRVLFTDVTKLQVDDQHKYVVVMVREAQDKSLFMTAYDPRTATEYELLGGPPHWKYAGLNDKNNDALLRKIYKTEEELQEAISNRHGKFTAELERYINNNDKTQKQHIQSAGASDSDVNVIRIGNVITPRLLVSVFNRKGKTEELLGSCQVSISSVLSGTGTDKIQWTTLLYEGINDSGMKSTAPAGKLNFMKLSYGDSYCTSNLIYL